VRRGGQRHYWHKRNIPVQPPFRRTFIIAVICGALAGCALTLPPPTVTSSGPLPGLTAHTVCPESSGLRHFTLDTEQPLTAVLECSPLAATFVVFNQYQVRVRTIRLMADGHIRDEVSYLCPDSTPAPEMLHAVQRLLASPAAATAAGVIRLAISNR
jgi:hypothetical protein